MIGLMLHTCLTRWHANNCQLFVGVYRNDMASISILRDHFAHADRLSVVIVPRDGPTTKGDCLNMLWLAMVRHECDHRFRFKAVVLHDAEDVVHPNELALFDFMIDRFDMVQTPVLPLVNQQSRWISGHYLDEFAEAHGKGMSVREAVGASLPSAGVGCAFSRDLLGKLSGPQGGVPFDADCLTEDYELGLRLAELGGRGAFVRMRDRSGNIICTREYFPETLGAAVRQKARWIVGISLAGWDRLGWRGGLAEGWMRLRDRRVVLSALVLAAAYISVLLYAGLLVIGFLTGTAAEPIPHYLGLLLLANGAFLAWRLALRAIFVTFDYGWREGARSVPRTLISNIVALAAAYRAVIIYVHLWRGRALKWDKTRHQYPDLPESHLAWPNRTGPNLTGAAD